MSRRDPDDPGGIFKPAGSLKTNTAPLAQKGKEMKCDELLTFSRDQLDWPLAKKLLKAGNGCYPEIFEALEGGGWEVAIDVRDSEAMSPFLEGLWILDERGSNSNKKWPTLDAARQAIRQVLPAGDESGVTVHFARC